MISVSLLFALYLIVRRIIRSWTDDTPGVDIVSDLTLIALCCAAAIYTITRINA